MPWRASVVSSKSLIRVQAEEQSGVRAQLPGHPLPLSDSGPERTIPQMATPTPRGQGVRAGDGQLGVVHEVLQLLVVAPVLAQLGAGRGAIQSLRRRQLTVERPKQKFKTVELLKPLFTEFFLPNP